MRNANRIKPFLKYIEGKWMENPDQRFGQLLVNLNIIEDTFQTWNRELIDYPLPHNVRREIITWSSLTGKIPFERKDIKIKDLETSHIKNILKTQTHIEDEFKLLLKDELKFRRKNGKK